MNKIIYTLLLVSTVLSLSAQSTEWFIIDQTGKDLRKVNADHIEQAGDLLKFSVDDKWGYMDLAGNIKVEAKFDEAGDFSDGLGLVKYNDKYGFVNTRNHLEIPNMYSQAGPFKEGRAMVLQSGKYGYIDRNGQKATPYKWSKVSEFSQGRAVVKLGFEKELGLINEAGDYVIERCCFEMNPPKDGMVAARKSGKYGYFDLEGNMVIENVYKKIYDFSEGLAFVKEDASFYGKYAVIDKQGKEVVPPTYETVDPNGFNSGVAGVQIDSKWGFIDKNGELVVEPQFDEITPFRNGVANVKKGFIWGYIDTKGEEVLPFIFDSKSPFIEGKRTVAFVQYNEAAKIANDKAVEEARIQKEYDEVMASADEQYANKAYSEAIELYEKAKRIKETDESSQKIADAYTAIRKIEADKAAEEARIKEEEARQKAEAEKQMNQEKQSVLDSLQEGYNKEDLEGIAEELGANEGLKQIKVEEVEMEEEVIEEEIIEETVVDVPFIVKSESTSSSIENHLTTYRVDLNELKENIASILTTLELAPSASTSKKELLLESISVKAEMCIALAEVVGLNEQTDFEDATELAKIKTSAEGLQKKIQDIGTNISEGNLYLLKAKTQLIELYTSKLERKLSLAD